MNVIMNYYCKAKAVISHVMFMLVRRPAQSLHTTSVLRPRCKGWYIVLLLVCVAPVLHLLGLRRLLDTHWPLNRLTAMQARYLLLVTRWE